MELDEDATIELKEEHEDDEASNSSDEEENEADVQSSESDLKEEKPLRDLIEKKDDASNARLVYTQQDINKLIALLVEQVPIVVFTSLHTYFSYEITQILYKK
jgi:hypothetical protein